MKYKFFLSAVFVLMLGISMNAKHVSSFNNEVHAGTGSSDETIVMTKLVAATSLDLSMFGKKDFNVTLKLSTDKVVAEYHKDTYSFSYSGDGNFISIDFRRDKPTLATGTYTIVPEANAKVGDCIAGYPALFGGGLWGSVWGKIAFDKVADKAIISGTVDVTLEGDIYKIIVNGKTDEGNVKVTYKGAITIPSNQ